MFYGAYVKSDVYIFFSVLSLTLSFSVLFEANDCLEIIVTLLLEQTPLFCNNINKRMTFQENDLPSTTTKIMFFSLNDDDVID